IITFPILLLFRNPRPYHSLSIRRPPPSPTPTLFPYTTLFRSYTDQLVYDIKDGLQLMREKYGDQLPSVISLATGPSRTADIEKTDRKSTRLNSSHVKISYAVFCLKKKKKAKKTKARKRKHLNC